jgi:hypothetical protein
MSEVNKKFFKLPLIISAMVFSFGMIVVWITHVGEINKVIAWIGAGYAAICFTFLLFQIYAFVQAHIFYDDDIENVKYKIFEAEDETL